MDSRRTIEAFYKFCAWNVKAAATAMARTHTCLDVNYIMLYCTQNWMNLAKRTESASPVTRGVATSVAAWSTTFRAAKKTNVSKVIRIQRNLRDLD